MAGLHLLSRPDPDGRDRPGGPPDPVLQAARDLLGPSVAVAGGPVEAWAAPLWPGEEEAVARAVPARRAEFAAGRASARAALAALGRPPVALPRRPPDAPTGPPLWPPGVTGSLSHGGGHVLAAVGLVGPGLRALGLDLEPFAPLPPDLAREVCHGGEDEGRAIEVFGAKEAAFKAQFALTGRLLDLRALRVTLHPGGRFRASFAEAVGPVPSGAVIEGRQAVAGGLLVSAARLPFQTPARPAPAPHPED